MAIVDGRIRCPACEQWLPLDVFLPSAVRKGSGKCRPCMAAYQLEWKRKNPDKSRAAHERWAAKQTPEQRRAQREATRERARASGQLRFYQVKSKYGITRADYERMWTEQLGCCAICGVATDRPLYVDHDHDTGVVRALLCQHCNTGLGMFDESVQRMRDAIAYLDRHQNQQPIGVAPAMRINLLPGAN